MTDVEINPETAPSPATTNWVPVGPSAAGAPGAPGAPGAGVPTPVVNGQWIKGVGGAAVWSAIADADVPSVASGRLSAGGVAITGNDCNQALQNGWYYGIPTAANEPPSSSGYFSLHVVALSDGSSVRQTAYDFNTDLAWVRRRQSSTWYPWIPLGIGGSAMPAFTVSGSPNQAMASGSLLGFPGSSVAYNVACTPGVAAQPNPAGVTLTRAGWYSFCIQTFWNGGSQDATPMQYLQCGMFAGGAAVRGFMSSNYANDAWTVTGYNPSNASMTAQPLVQLTAAATLTAFTWTVTLLATP